MPLARFGVWMQCMGVFLEETVCQLWEDATKTNVQMKIKAGGTGVYGEMS